MCRTACVADNLTFDVTGEIIVSVGWNPSFLPAKVTLFSTFAHLFFSH
jgi:hypothetical protein